MAAIAVILGVATVVLGVVVAAAVMVRGVGTGVVVWRCGVATGGGPGFPRSRRRRCHSTCHAPRLLQVGAVLFGGRRRCRGVSRAVGAVKD